MVNSESNNRRSIDFEESPTRENIREWRNSMETFFAEDWPKVGEIITRLEDSLWDQSQHKTLDSSDVTDCEQNLDYKEQINAMQKPRVPVSSDPEQKLRLENLARKIEDRLNHNHQA